MTLRFRKTTSCLLLAAWPLVLGLATGWHTHSHGGHCATTACCEHQHAPADHHHHSHHHATHTDTDRNHQDEDSSPGTPHRSDGCQSCQLLALSGVVSQSLPAFPSLPLCERTETEVATLPELDAPTCYHLRGPPAGMTV